MLQVLMAKTDCKGINQEGLDCDSKIFFGNISKNKEFNQYKEKLLKRHIGSIKATELTDYLYSLSTSHAHAYISSIHKFMKVLWNFTDKRQYLKSNIIESVKIPAKGVEEGKIKIYTEEELDIFEKRFSSTNLITAFKLGRVVGGRKAEIFALLWSDINWDEHTIKINKQLAFEDKMWTLRNTKTVASIREIDIQDDIYNYLKELKTQQAQQEKEYGIVYRKPTIA